MAFEALIFILGLLGIIYFPLVFWAERQRERMREEQIAKIIIAAWRKYHG